MQAQQLIHTHTLQTLHYPKASMQDLDLHNQARKHRQRLASDIQGRYAASALNPGERGKL